MNTPHIHKYDPTVDVLSALGSENSTLALLSESNMSPESFYLTGFEAISFNRRKSFAIETVLSSVANFDNEVLILNTGDRSYALSALCDKLHVSYRMVGLDEVLNDAHRLKDTLKQNRHISHMLVCEDDTFSLQDDQMKMFGDLAAAHKLDLIVECARKPLSLRQAVEFGISFLVSPILGCANQSLILARRSRLVQAEGRSRSMVHDLYRYWQRIVAQRRHVIEPMAI